jgi:roadblock/LC7 domain-containing protein
MEMAQWFCVAVTAMFGSMAFAVNSVSPSGGFEQTSWLPLKGWTFFGGEYSIAVHGDRFLLAETEKIKSFDELRRLLREEGP